VLNYPFTKYFCSGNDLPKTLVRNAKAQQDLLKPESLEERYFLREGDNREDSSHFQPIEA
jgi:hypothetical protein